MLSELPYRLLHEDTPHEMEDEETVTLHPRDLLRQILNFLSDKQPDHAIVLPTQTTVRDALQAIQSAFYSLNEPILLMYGAPLSTSTVDIRQIGVEESDNPFVLRMSTDVHSLSMQPPPRHVPRSERRRLRLRELAGQMARVESTGQGGSLLESGS
ncbi:hypothetical protein BDW74DRAFT_175682 [Aspergillus multicolor]|uniref:uncharacterized protein n=1 Tax=Aspergillus multicolor TaxID=41759 RepID=UPI003CCD4BDD